MIMLANFSSYCDKQKCFFAFLSGVEHERRYGLSHSRTWTSLQPCFAQTKL